MIDMNCEFCGTCIQAIC